MAPQPQTRKPILFGQNAERSPELTSHAKPPSQPVAPTQDDRIPEDGFEEALSTLQCMCSVHSGRFDIHCVYYCLSKKKNVDIQ